MNLAISMILKAVDKVTGPLKSIGGAVSRFQTVIQKNQKAIASGFKGTATAAGFIVGATAAASAAIFAVAKSTSKLGDELNDTAGYLGMSTKALQEYYYMGKLSGVETSDMTTALSKLTVNLGKAGKDKGLQQTLAALGVTVQDLKSAGPDKSLDLIANGFQRIKDPSLRAMYATELFGKSGIKMVNVLSQGSAGMDELRKEAEKTGSILSGDAINAAAAFDDQFNRLKATLEGVKNRIGAALLPQVTAVMVKLTDFVQNNAQGIMNILNPIIGVAGTIFQTIGDALVSLAPLFGTVAQVVGILGQALSGIFPSIANLAMVLAQSLGPVFTALTPIIQVVGNLIVILANALARIMPVLMPLIAVLMQALVPILQMLEPIFAIIVDLLASWLGPVLQIISFIIGTLLVPVLNILKEVFLFVVGLIKPIYDGISWVFNTISKFIGGLFGGGKKDEKNTAAQGDNLPTGTQLSPSVYNKTTTEKTEVQVRFDNMPQGTKVKPGKMSKNLDLSMGYGNVAF